MKSIARSLSPLFVTACVAISLGLPTPAFAQAVAGFGSLRASDEAAEDDTASERLLANPPLRLVSFAPSRALRARVQRAPRTMLTGFNRARYGFDTLSVYFDRDTPPEAERGLSSSGTLRLVVEQQAAGRSRWWRLELADADAKGRGAPAVIFLSDWLADGMQTWEKQLDAVSTSRMAVVPLHSGTPDLDGSVNTIDALASNALRVMTHLSLEKPILVGHGMGARVALEISRRAPDALGGLVLINFTRAVNLETLLAFLASDHAAQKEIVRGRLSPAAPDDLVSAITFMLSGRTGYQKLPGTASAISYVTYPVYDALTSGVRAPIRVIASAEDPSLAAMAGGRLQWILIPTQGEFPMLEAPEVFTRALMRAIEELGASRR